MSYRLPKQNSLLTEQEPGPEPGSRPLLQELTKVLPQNQINDLKHDEMILGNLDALAKKYNQFQVGPSRRDRDLIVTVTHDAKYGKYDEMKEKERETILIQDPYEELIMTKNDTIDDLRKEILRLNQESVDLTVLYNVKIENLRQDHRKELHAQYKEFMKKISARKKAENERTV